MNKELQKKETQDLRSLIKKNTEMLAMALPKTITADRMARIAMTAITRNPKLAACNTQSFFGALLTAAQLGIEVNTPLGQAYLIPYGTQCQFQMGYQGILDLAYRSQQYKRIKAVVVKEGDSFSYSYGLNPSLEHVPTGTGEPTHVYAVYELTNGGGDFEVWTWEQVMEHAKKYSQSFGAKESSWKTAKEEMAKKTVLKALLKYAPKSVELAEAVVSDEGIIKKVPVREGGGVDIVTDIDHEVVAEPNSDIPKQKTAEKNNTPSTSKNAKAQAANRTAQTPTQEDDEALNRMFEDQQN